MSETAHPATPTPPPTGPSPEKASPHPHRLRHILEWIFFPLIIIVLLAIIGGAYYTTTPDFQRRVSKEVVSVIENATGGRVDLGHLSFNLWHLAIEADGLVIHGTEGPGQMPYFSAEKIFVRLRLNTFISHTVGKGAQSHIGVSYLRVEEPHFHLIIDKNGKTNQPVPAHPAKRGAPIQDTLLNLQAGKVQLVNGLAVLNNRAVPFDLAARDLNVEIHYIASTDRYGATVDLADLQTKMVDQPEVQSKLHLTAEIGRDMASLDSLDFSSGAATHLSANATVQHFANPQWKANVSGGVQLKQLGYLTGLDGFSAGTVSLDVHGHSCDVTPQVAQKQPHFWQHHRDRKSAAAKVLPPSPDCPAGYLLVGSVKAHGVAYRIPEVRIHDVDAAAQLHVTPTELLFTALTSTLPGGGKIAGELKIDNWLGEVPPSAPTSSATSIAAATTIDTAAKNVGAAPPLKKRAFTPVKPLPTEHAHAYLTVKVDAISLRTIMDITAPEHYGDLGFDTAIDGPVKVEWGGPVTSVADSVEVDAALNLHPTGLPNRGYPSNIPLSGTVRAHYDGRTEVVNIAQVAMQTPASNINVSGVLGVDYGDPLTNLQVNLQTRNLGEFDQTLKTLDFEADGKKGAAAIPVVLHGTMDFTGTAKGAVEDLHVKGHLTANNVEAKLGPTTDIQIDSVVGDAEYSPFSGVAIAQSTITRGSAVLNVSGSFAPRKFVTRRGLKDYVWDDGTSIDAKATLANAQMTDLLQIAGQQNRVPLTGTVNVDLHAAGTIKDLTGGGSIVLTKGVVYGEPYQTIALDLNAQGDQINATRVLLEAHGMSITGSGAYNIASKHIQAAAQGSNLVLSKFDVIAKNNRGVDGVLSFHATADGTAEVPNLHATIALAKLTVQGEPLGSLQAAADSAGSTVSYQLTSNLVGTQLTAHGQTSLLGDYQTNATLNFTGFDVGKSLALFSSSTIQATSAINGSLTVNGPAAKPMQLAGTATLSSFDVKAEGIELKSAEPVEASLRDGVVTLEKLHITGQNTDLNASGTATLFGDNNPQGGPIDVNATGKVSMALVRTFDKDLLTSGEVSFNIAASGRLKAPQMNGKVQFQNVNVAVDGIPNGLDQMNGTMIFNQNRLTVQNVTAMTGGGQLKLGGFISYQKGVFADLTATTENTRVRLYGLSATANSSFRLQGGPQSVLLSGNVLVTRFGIGPDVDFAAFASSGGVEAPPDPNAATNKIHLDIHVTSSPQLDFQNSYAKLAGNVNLNIRGTVAVPSILGRIQITDGSATFAGTKYELQRGNIYFLNPVRIDPTIDLDATTRVENYDITIGLQGTISKLKPTYRSSPPLTEADIFNLLALGRTQEEAQLYQEQQVQAGVDPTTSALLGGALNATVSSRVSKLFGAGSVKIDPAFVGTLGNSTARITVQEPLSKQLTLVFATNVNQTAEQLIQLQYQIDQSKSVVITRDESGVFSVVFKLRKRYH